MVEGLKFSALTWWNANLGILEKTYYQVCSATIRRLYIFLFLFIWWKKDYQFVHKFIPPGLMRSSLSGSCSYHDEYLMFLMALVLTKLHNKRWREHQYRLFSLSSEFVADFKHFLQLLPSYMELHMERQGPLIQSEENSGISSLIQVIFSGLVGLNQSFCNWVLTRDLLERFKARVLS